MPKKIPKLKHKETLEPAFPFISPSTCSGPRAKHKELKKPFEIESRITLIINNIEIILLSNILWFSQ